jgi:hypothetical protein
MICLHCLQLMHASTRFATCRVLWTPRSAGVHRNSGKSLNEIAIEALARGAGISGERSRKRDLSDIVGTWQHDPEFDEAIAAQDTVDEDLWR